MGGAKRLVWVARKQALHILYYRKAKHILLNSNWTVPPLVQSWLRRCLGALAQGYGVSRVILLSVVPGSVLGHAVFLSSGLGNYCHGGHAIELCAGLPMYGCLPTISWLHFAHSIIGIISLFFFAGNAVTGFSLLQLLLCSFFSSLVLRILLGCSFVQRSLGKYIVGHIWFFAEMLCVLFFFLLVAGLIPSQPCWV